jgi:hypothetical protein
MSMATRYQRVFSHCFPAEESPFLSEFVQDEQFRPDQQRDWDIVTRVLKPEFSNLSGEDTIKCATSCRDELTVVWKDDGMEAWARLSRNHQKAVQTWYLGMPTPIRAG